MRSLNYRTLAKYLSEKKNDIPETAWLRSFYASISTPSFARPYVITNYATDLGVRVRLDPNIYLREVAKLAGINLLDYESSYSAEKHLDEWGAFHGTEEQMRQDLDVLINYAGVWKSAADLSCRYIKVYGLPTDYLLATYCAAALGTCNHFSLTETIYKHLESSICNPVELAMTSIRHAAFEIKRQQNIDYAYNILDNNNAVLEQSANNQELSFGDMSTLLGVSNNLRALAKVKEGYAEEARNLINQARIELSTDSILVTVGDDERKRYFEQATINLLQLMIFDGKIADARDMATQHLDWVKKNHFDYIGEAYHALGYIDYLDHDYISACKHIQLGISKMIHDGNVTAAQSAKRILAVSYAKLNIREVSYNIIKSMTSDPAGLSFCNVLNSEAE